MPLMVLTFIATVVLALGSKEPHGEHAHEVTEAHYYVAIAESATL